MSILIIKCFRYIKENVASSDDVGRTYSVHVPEYIRNRPAAFIKTCMEKISLSEDIDEMEMQRKSDCFEVNLS